MMRSKLMLTVLAFSILFGFTAAFAQTTVTADQVKVALDKFTAARTEYQTLVRSGAEKTKIDAAYSKFIAAQAEYQQLNKAAGNCLTPGSGKQANQNGNGQGSGLKKRDGSCGQSGTQQGASGAGKMQGKGKGRGGR